MGFQSDIDCLVQLSDFSRRHPQWHFYPVSLHSRIHAFDLKIPNKPSLELLLKRDDELSFGISGSKLRKFSSLLGAWQQQSNPFVIIQGSTRSNSVIGLTQLLREAGIPFHCVLKKSYGALDQGNGFLAQLLLAQSEVTLVRDAQAGAEAVREIELLHAKNNTVNLLPEGGDCFEAIPGAMTAAYDIPVGQLESLQQIFVDSGTGVFAIGLILGLALREVRGLQIHIVLIAGNESEFLAKLARYHSQLEACLGFSLPQNNQLHFVKPTSAAKFGRTNAKIFQAIVEIARSQGVLADPIYTAKYFLTCAEELARCFPVSLLPSDHRDQILLWHSGGAHSLYGYTQQVLSACAAVEDVN